VYLKNFSPFTKEKKSHLPNEAIYFNQFYNAYGYGPNTVVRNTHLTKAPYSYSMGPANVLDEVYFLLLLSHKRRIS
jgi:hypothetical protein